jgi:hypothetical protein
MTGAAGAKSASVTIDDTAPGLASGENGTFTSALGFTNLTSTPLPIVVAPPANAGANCKLTADPSMLPAAEHTDVTVTVAAACAVDERRGISFTVAVPGQSPKFAVTSAPAPSSTPDWSALDAFWIALIAVGVVAFGVWIVLKAATETESLIYLDSTWSFSDSWAGNVTVIAGLLTGIFGTSDIVTNFLGTNADSAVAVAVVGGAVAAALVATAPIILIVTRNLAGSVTVAGFLAACAVTLAGAYGELWTVYASAHRMSLGGLQDNLIYPTLAAMVLLGLYAVRSVITVIQQGHKAPAKVSSDTILAARTVVMALQGKADIDKEHVETALKELTEQHPQLANGTITVDPIRKRRAALL